MQERAGVRAGADKIGASIDDEIAPAAAHFLSQRYTLYVASLDERGRPWASELFGPPGFVTITGPRSLHVDAKPRPGDPLRDNLGASPEVGLLGIDLATRRRYRVNGTATVSPDGGLAVSVRQAFGNCPKYIQRREPADVVEPALGPSAVTRGTLLDAGQRARLARADTFFLATAHPTAGADVSHRGGAPGFVQTPDEHTIVWPDYRGNTMFMSLGNIAAAPRAGILVVDFETGDVLQVTGAARIDWDPERARAFAGAERVVELMVEGVVDASGASPLRWRFLDASPFNP